MTKSLPKIITLLIVAFFFATCKGESSDSNCIGCGENLIYGTQKSGATMEEVVPVVIMDTTLTVDENFAKNKVKIEKIYGEQWDFCHCIVANDSLDKVVKSGAEIDDAFMDRFSLVDQKCKAFLVMSPNQTPDERAVHEKKTKNCLRNNGY